MIKLDTPRRLHHRVHFLLSSAIASIVLLTSLAPAWADSPLTSTNLSTAYDDLLEVRYAKRTKVLDSIIFNFLNSDAPIDQKVAVVNALGWNFNGQTNGLRFLEAFATSQNKPLGELQLSDLSTSDRIILGYLLALDDYFDLSSVKQTRFSGALWSATPLNLLSQAAYDQPKNFTVQFILSLVQAQQSTVDAWCERYLQPAQVLAQFAPPQRNMREQAIQSAMSYINVYESYCQIQQ